MSAVFSLLYPPQADKPVRRAPKIDADDNLRIAFIARALADKSQYENAIRDILETLCDDVEVIAYRQDILQDFIEHPQFTKRLRPALGLIHRIASYAEFAVFDRRDGQLRAVIGRLGELESYVECIQELHAILAEHPHLKSDGLNTLRGIVQDAYDDSLFQELIQTLPDLMSSVRGINSITVGVNITSDFYPSEVTLLSINKHKFKGPRFLTGLWSGAHRDEDEQHGLTQLRRNPATNGGIPLAPIHDIPLEGLFSDLSLVMAEISRPIAAALKHFLRVNTGFLRQLENEFAFYLGASDLANRVSAANLPLSLPSLAPPDERLFAAEDLYNIDFALRLMNDHPQGDLSQKLVVNDARFDDEGRIHILTGPNRGGKTTFTQAIGLIHVMAQAGLFIPAASGTLSPVDRIFLHYPVKEHPAAEAGRLGEESARLREIFQSATHHSLILMNESLASTSAGESYYLARDIIKSLRKLGARAIFVTHLHDLAADAEAINTELDGASAVQSLVSIVDEDSQPDGGRRTYRIIPAPPMGNSYAREIARKYGISFEQIDALLKSRANNSPE